MCGRLANCRDRDHMMMQQSCMVGTWHDFVDSDQLLRYKGGSMFGEEKASFERVMEDAKTYHKSMVESAAS